MTYTESFPIQFAPAARADAVVIREHVRFTVLTSRLLRLEYDPSGIFEDRPSQAFWYRDQPVPDYEVMEENGRFLLQTNHLIVSYGFSAAGFTAESISITLKENNTTWDYGDANPLNLRGTTRTLDQVDGVIALEEGLLSRSGWAVYDDTDRLVFDESGWLVNRQASQGYQDLYFFGYGSDYSACLSDFAKVAGPAPLIPRWSLGNWWSRYWEYSADELLGLMDEFAAKAVPLSVCIVDMDWHITKTGNDSTGWTGYTWNRRLFPDPQAFIQALRSRGLKTALNLHPAEGIHAHEAQYGAMATAMGIDPAFKMPVPFSIADPTFTKAYFELLHHPQEEDGIDFWWMDWQQGTVSGLDGLDPLWWLNHLHFYDLGREGKKRPFIFSRWGGLGNHRYPIGFSGDTVVSWESLAFQPYFTAAAANVNYGWWSHDIGGHMGGIEEPELYARWVQFGVFSPILRLHSTKNSFHERLPWEYDAETERVASHALRLRHAFIPYLYTMAQRNHTKHVPLIRAMYFEHPRDEPAYHCPDQYWFGSELIVAPFNAPADADTRLSRQVVWLPQGDWFDFFTGLRYAGDGWQVVYGRLDDIPVFAKAGAIVPLAVEENFAQRRGDAGVGNPDRLELHLFPGADNVFDLFEDDGGQKSSVTPIRQNWSAQSWAVSIGPVQGEVGHLPKLRTYTACFRGVMPDGRIVAQRNGEEVEVVPEYDAEMGGVRVTAVSLTPTDIITITLSTPGDSLLTETSSKLAACQKCAHTFRMNSRVKERLYHQLPTLIEKPALLQEYGLILTESQLRALAEIITEAGMHRTATRRSDDEMILLWNNHEAENVAFQWQAFVDRYQHAGIQEGPLPKFGVFTLGEETITYHEGNQPAAGRASVTGWLAGLPGRIRKELVAEMDAVAQFEVRDGGEHGRVVHLVLQNGQAALTEGPHLQPDVVVLAQKGDWLSLINGDLSPEELFLSGKLSINGDLNLLLQLVDVMQIAPPSQYRAERWQLTLRYANYLTLLRRKPGDS